MKKLIKLQTRLSVLLFIILLSTTQNLSAQNGSSILKGIISDTKSKEGLAFVDLKLKTPQGKFIKGTTTNVEGKYEIKNINPGAYQIEASYIGYEKYLNKKIIIKSNETQTLNIKLSQATVLIKELEVAEEKHLPGLIHYSKRSKKISSKNYRMNSSGYSTSGDYKTPDYNTESYAHNPENNFKNTKSTPLSTFSIDVDAASYSNMRRFINNGQNPPIDAVRIEEMINYFNYDYAKPKGEDPFSITTELSDCPWNSKHKLVHIGLQGEKIDTKDLPASNLVFLLDVSGSMSSPNKLPLLKKSFSLLVNNLTSEDRVSIVVYAGAAGLVLEPTPGNENEKIMNALNRLQSGGSTAGGQGIKLAYKVAMENLKKDGNNRIILATDGDFNIGASSDGEMTRLIEKKRESGIFLTCLGFGMGNYKDSKMETLADKGNGNYAYIDNILEAKKVLVTEMGGTMHTIAKVVKLQLEFNPNKVASYKLIGYENRLLNDEDFNDDTKDAGELGSGHTVTALYEIVLKGSSEDIPSVDPLRYQNEETVKGSSTNELLTVKFRYKEPKGSKSKLIVKHLNDKSTQFAKVSNNFKFSAAVAEFGLLLRNSKHKAQASYDHVVKLAKNSKGSDDNGYRAEFIRLVEMSEMQASALLDE